MSKRAKEDEHLIKTLEEEGIVDDDLRKDIIEEILEDKELQQALKDEQLLDEELEVDKRLLFKCGASDKKVIETDLKEAHKKHDDVAHLLRNEIRHRLNLENELQQEISKRKALEAKLAKELSKRA